MKKIAILLMSVAVIILLTQCSSPASENKSNHSTAISEMMNNEAYMNEVMDSMRTKHPDVIQSSFVFLMKDNKQIQGSMMDNMMDMSKMDTAICKKMMGKTMEICDMDKSKCSMMMGAMQDHPKGTKTMKDMGMCNMKGMDMTKMK